MKLPGAALAAAAFLVAQPAFAQDFGADCEPADLAALAEWGGVWTAENGDAVDQGLSGRAGSSSAPLLGLGAPWNDAGRERMAAVWQTVGTGPLETSGWGFPMMMYSYSEFTLAAAPAVTTMVNQYSEVRQIYTDGRGHLPDDVRWATNWGDSIGCWQGDTLVIETISARYDPDFNPFAPPLSEAARFVERLRLVGPGRLQNIITITDPELLSEPWTLELYYVPAGLDRLVLEAFTDRNDVEGGTITPVSSGLVPVDLPPTLTMTEAQLDRYVGSYQLSPTPLVMHIVRQGNRLLFNVPPAQVDLMGIYPQTETSFALAVGTPMDFVLDSAGRVTGFTTVSPQGEPTTGTRIGD